jgi:hypothetical protein
MKPRYRATEVETGKRDVGTSCMPSSILTYVATKNSMPKLNPASREEGFLVNGRLSLSREPGTERLEPNKLTRADDIQAGRVTGKNVSCLKDRAM